MLIRDVSPSLNIATRLPLSLDTHTQINKWGVNDAHFLAIHTCGNYSNYPWTIASIQCGRSYHPLPTIQPSWCDYFWLVTTNLLWAGPQSKNPTNCWLKKFTWSSYIAKSAITNNKWHVTEKELFKSCFSSSMLSSQVSTTSCSHHTPPPLATPTSLTSHTYLPHSHLKLLEENVHVQTRFLIQQSHLHARTNTHHYCCHQHTQTNIS